MDRIVQLINAAPEPLVLDPSDPMSSARKLVAKSFLTVDNLRKLHRHRRAFWEWNGAHYRLADDETMAATIWNFLDGAQRMNQNGAHVPFRPNTTKVNDVAAALKAITQLDGNIEPPVWLTREDGPPAQELVAC